MYAQCLPFWPFAWGPESRTSRARNMFQTPLDPCSAENRTFLPEAQIALSCFRQELILFLSCARIGLSCLRKEPHSLP